jgi:hypothetical protein
MIPFPAVAKISSCFAICLSGLLLTLPATIAKAQCPGTAAGYTIPTVSINVATTGTDSWNNPWNALSDNNSYATMSNAALLIGGTVRTSNFLLLRNFGFDLPANAQVCGVQVEIRKFSSDNTGSNYTRDLDIRLLKNNQVVGINHANTGVNWPATETAFTYGTNADLWGATLNGFDVNNNGFGVAISIESRAAGLLLPTVISYIDQVRLRVYYYIPPVDIDGDGIVDGADSDMDGDGLPDSKELIACNSPSPLTLSDAADASLSYPSAAGVAMALYNQPTAGAGVSEFSIAENYPAIAGPEIRITQDPITAIDNSTVSLRFNTPVHNLGFKLQDIDFVAGQSKDNVTVNAYHAGQIYPIGAANVDIGPGNFNTFTGNNTFAGMAEMSNTEINGTISITIPDMVDSIQFIFKNADPGLGFQEMGIGDISFCNAYAAIQDIDGDGIPGFRDADSDNDGIPDLLEIQPATGFIMPAGMDINNNGLDDAFDPGAGGIALTAVHTDNDGVPDYRDLDSDNDGFNDQIEGNDADRNCIADFALSGADADVDGLDNNYDMDNGGTAAPVQDSDGNGTPDYRQNNIPTMSIAGADQTGSADTFQLSANAPLLGGGLGYWSVYSGTGTFAQVNDPATNVANLALGANRYVWTIYTDGCHHTSDTVSITRTIPLPVRIATFTARKQGSQAVLNWSTLMEENNKGFGVQRSADGVRWEQVQFVPSLAVAGNSPTRLDYTAYDRHPLAGLNFYRIFQQDIDGKGQYTDIQPLLFPKEGRLFVYPNPATARIHFSWGDTPHIKMLRLLDAMGKIVFSSEDASLRSIDMSGRAPGLYLVQVLYANGIEESCTLVKE